MGVLTDIAAATGFSETVYSSDPVNSVAVCLPRSNRFCIIFAFDATGGGIISTNPDPLILTGFVGSPGGHLNITVKDYGPLAQQQWWLKPSFPGVTITVFEVYFPGE